MTLSRNLSTLGQAVTTGGNLPTANLTGTIASAQLSGSYTGITGVGTLAAGSIPSSLITGLTTGSTANVQTFNSTGTWTKPSGVSMAYIQMWGGGGGGANGGNAGLAGGGGGAYNEIIVPVSSLAASVTATVGAGGTSASGTSAGVGGTSSFALATAFNGISTLYAYGGGGGYSATAQYGVGGGGGGSLGAGSSGTSGSGGGSAGSGVIPAGYQTLSIGCPSTTFYIYNQGIDGGGIGGRSQQVQIASHSIYGGGGGVTGFLDGQSLTGGKSIYGGGGGGASAGGACGIARSAGTSLFGGNGGAGGVAGTAPAGGGGSGAAGAAGRIIVTCW